MSLDRTEIEALLPFLANDTLTGDERREVETAVAADPGLQAELRALKGIRAQMQAEPAESSPGELGLARLMRDIDRETAAARTETPASTNVVPLSRLRIWQAAAVVVLGLGLGQAVLTNAPPTTLPAADELAAPPAPIALEQAPAASNERGFELAGEDAAQIAAFRVIFAEDTTEATLRALLLDAGVEIVAGPSSLGFYELAVIAGDAQSARAVLQGAGPVIETLEDLSAE